MHADKMNTEITQKNLNNWNIISLKIFSEANLFKNFNIWKTVWCNQLVMWQKNHKTQKTPLDPSWLCVSFFFFLGHLPFTHFDLLYNATDLLLQQIFYECVWMCFTWFLWSLCTQPPSWDFDVDETSLYDFMFPCHFLQVSDLLHDNHISSKWLAYKQKHQG